MAEKLSKLRDDRIRKLESLRASGIDPFSHKKFERSHGIDDVRKAFSAIQPDEQLKDAKVSVAGRLRSIRLMGKGGFADIEDAAGKVQLWVASDTVSKNDYASFKNTDVGDIAGVKGYIFKTKKGELTIWVESFLLLSKSLRPLPSEWYGLKDVETRYRQRYVDLVMNPEVKKTFQKRSKIIQAIREYFVDHGYLEVETPILQPIYGGAFARPFVTHHNALDMKMYLRISNEMYLKRLIVGGLEKVFEFSPDFRNEGVDTTHNPEFLMLEAMTAYDDYRDGMKLFENLVSHAAQEALGTMKVEYQGTMLDFTPPWKRVRMVDVIKEQLEIDVMKSSEKDLEDFIRKRGIKIKPDHKKGELINVIFEEFVESKLIQPTIVHDYPIEVSALAKKCDDNPQFTERFEVYIAGREAGNNYTEINDPLELARRFKEELKRGQAGDEEAHPMDEDFLRAVEYGMPPTCGIGVGMERIIMFLTNSPSIRDVMLFPALRTTKEEIYGDEDKFRVEKKPEEKKPVKLPVDEALGKILEKPAGSKAKPKREKKK